MSVFKTMHQPITAMPTPPPDISEAFDYAVVSGVQWLHIWSTDALVDLALHVADAHIFYFVGKDEEFEPEWLTQLGLQIFLKCVLSFYIIVFVCPTKISRPIPLEQAIFTYSAKQVERRSK